MCGRASLPSLLFQSRRARRESRPSGYRINRPVSATGLPRGILNHTQSIWRRHTSTQEGAQEDPKSGAKKQAYDHIRFMGVIIQKPPSSFPQNLCKTPPKKHLQSTREGMGKGYEQIAHDYVQFSDTSRKMGEEGLEYHLLFGLLQRLT